MDKSQILNDTFEAHKVKASVIGVVKGPRVTQYQVRPERGVKISSIVSLTDDLALALAAIDIRIEAPIPGISAVGIEIPNDKEDIEPVNLSNLLQEDTGHPLVIPIGRDIRGGIVYMDIRRNPHLLVAGATGSGKSVCINGIISSIAHKADPKDVRFMMIDPKMVELTPFNGLPHLSMPVITNPDKAVKALGKLVSEMTKRYQQMSDAGVRNIEAYNSTAGIPKRMSYIVLIIDELADLMMTSNSKDTENDIARLAQLARAAGIHMIIATQRPSVNVVTGIIKANIPSRIAFSVASAVDSSVILDMGGAEKLLGAGDMLYSAFGSSKPIRVQGAYASDEEIGRLAGLTKSNDGLPLHI